ncbi:MAG: shikimate dehydrogenase [Bacteroidales bacterium]|nr:shikimate dehydrogenase [Bacteroidales bacterium]
MKVYGLIGYPLTHSFSKTYFTNKFKDENIKDVSYLNLPILSVKLFSDILKTVNGIAGINVTSPYKEQIIPYLDELDETARKIGAVNVIKIINKNSKQKLIGYNTDVFGFMTSLKEHIPEDVNNALILGTGGAAKAVASALEILKINFKFVTSKNNKKNNKTLLYSELNSEVVKNNLLIVNATPLGLFPDINKKPDIPYQFITNKHLLFDLIYNPTKTLFLKEGEKKGATIVNGYEMLKYQAEKAWEIFNS